jgi:hypothetical protein
MADVVWAAEEIPNQDHVYMRAHRTFFRGSMLLPGVFCPHGGGMSTDWDKYATPAETQSRARKPEDNAVLKLPVSGIRAIKNLEIKHTPDSQSQPPNRAHSDVLGIPDSGEGQTEARASLLDIASVVIPAPRI